MRFSSSNSRVLFGDDACFYLLPAISITHTSRRSVLKCLGGKVNMNQLVNGDRKKLFLGSGIRKKYLCFNLCNYYLSFLISTREIQEGEIL